MPFEYVNDFCVSFSVFSILNEWHSMFLAVKRHIIDYFVCTNSSVSTVESTTFPYQRNFHFLFPFTFDFEISIWTAQPRLERDVKCNLQCLKCMTFPTWDFVTVNQAADTERRDSGEKWIFHLLCYAISALFNQQHNITSLHSKKQNWSSQNSLFHSHDEKKTLIRPEVDVKAEKEEEDEK